MRALCIVMIVVCLAGLVPAKCQAEVQVWDAWVYHWVRIWLYNEWGYPAGFADVYNTPCDVVANPVECSESDYYAYWPDRFRFTFDGRNLSVNRTSIWTVGGSSCTASSLLLSGSWAVFGTVTDSILTPDPYATLVGGAVQWAANTPIGYTANLLLGYSFEGDGAPMYQRQPSYNYPPQQGTTLMIRTYSPRMGYDYPDSYAFRNHIFTATYIPEPSAILALLCGVGGLAMRFRWPGNRGG